MRAAPERAQHWIVFVLKWGSVLAAGVLLAGVLLVVVTAAGQALQVGPPVSASLLAAGLAHLDAYAVIQLGILLLLLTPLARLAAAVLSFWLEGDRRYALVSLAVLLIIVTSILLAHPLG